jgi:hypothetical protein
VSTGQTLGMRRGQPERIEDDVSATVELIQTYLSRFEPNVELDQQHGWWTVELPRPAGGEYRFSLHGELGGERQISARLARTTKSRTRTRFWYSPLELADFRDDPSKLERLFHERLKALMVFPTRIVENKGIILLSYSAEYQGEAGWQRLGDVSYLGLGFGIPLVGKKRVYISPPVVNCSQE